MAEQPLIPAEISNDLSLREIILKTRNIINFFLRYWKLLVFLGVAGFVIGYLKALKTKPTYTADLNFVVEDGKSGGGLSAYAGLASQFGIDLGGSASSGLFQGDNIIVFLKSRLMIQKALFTPYPTDTTRSLAQVFFESSGMKNDWDSKERTQKVSFPLKPVAQFSLMQDSALSLMHTSIVKDYLEVERPDKKMSFLKVSFTDADPVFARAFVLSIVSTATDFYVQAKTKRSKTNVESLQAKSDSLQAILNEQTYASARTQDLNLNPAKRVLLVNTEISNRNKAIALTMFTEVTKNLEIAKMTLAQEMPIIQIVDSPEWPLIMKRKSRTLKGMGWGIGFGLFGMFLISIVKFKKLVNVNNKKEIL
jgi:hypothetical protein